MPHTENLSQNLKQRHCKWHARCVLNILVRIIMMHNQIADKSNKNKRLKGRINNIRNRIFKIYDVTLFLYPLKEASVVPKGRVSSIQHPGGGPKQVAMYHNLVTYVGEGHIQYLTDTMPGSVKAEEIKQLKEMGWKDRDLVDALAHGANMVDHSIMMEVFQMDQDCMVS